MHDVYHPWREALRSLWFAPAVFVLVALATGYGLSQIEVTESILPGTLRFDITPTAARELLAVIAGTMITVTSVVFVLTVVALQIASSQFSLRLLRSFLQDRGTRVVLGVFVATFAYSLGGLFAVGQTTDQGELFVPRLAITGAVLLAFLSVAMLVYYIQHITNAIRLNTVMLRIRQATHRTIQKRFPNPALESEYPETGRPVPPTDALVIASTKAGYIQGHDIQTLVDLARTAHVSVRLRHQIGQHVVAGAPLAWVWGDGPTPDPDTLIGSINRAVVRSHERHVEEDVAFGIRQLVDIGLRAVAPSVNDPYTAVQAIQHLSTLIAELATVDIHDECHYEGDRLLLFAPVPSFETILYVVCTNLRRSAHNRPRVLIELFRMLETAAVVGTPSSQRAVLAHQADVIWRDVERTIDLEVDLVRIRSYADRAVDAAATGKLRLDSEQGAEFMM